MERLLQDSYGVDAPAVAKKTAYTNKTSGSKTRKGIGDGSSAHLHRTDKTNSIGQLQLQTRIQNPRVKNDEKTSRKQTTAGRR